MNEGSESEAAVTSEPGQEPVAEVVAPQAEVTTETTASETDPFDDAKVETFDRAYVEKLRNEAAAKRTELNKFKETFKAWPEEAVEGFLGLAKAIESGDESAVPVLQNLLSELSPKEQEAVIEALTSEEETPAEEKKFLSAEDVEKLLAEKEAAKEAERVQEESLKAITSEITDLGYNLDAPNEDATLLFHFAQQQTEPVKDFKAAHEKVQAFKQAIIDNYVGSKREKNSRFASHASAAGLTPTGVDGGKKNLGLANGGSRAALEALLASTD